MGIAPGGLRPVGIFFSLSRVCRLCWMPGDFDKREAKFSFLIAETHPCRQRRVKGASSVRLTLGSDLQPRTCTAGSAVKTAETHLGGQCHRQTPASASQFLACPWEGTRKGRAWGRGPWRSNVVTGGYCEPARGLVSAVSFT